MAHVQYMCVSLFRQTTNHTLTHTHPGIKPVMVLPCHTVNTQYCHYYVIIISAKYIENHILIIRQSVFWGTESPAYRWKGTLQCHRSKHSIHLYKLIPPHDDVRVVLGV